MKEFIDLLSKLTTEQLSNIIEQDLASENFYVPTELVLKKIIKKDFPQVTFCSSESWQFAQPTYSRDELAILYNLCQMIYDESDATIDQNKLDFFQKSIGQTKFNASSVVPWELLRKFDEISFNVETEVYEEVTDDDLSEGEEVNEGAMTNDLSEDENDGAGITLLSFAVYCQNEQVVNFLLKYGWNFEQNKYSKQTIFNILLWKMVAEGNEAIAKMLVDAGANPFHMGDFDFSSHFEGSHYLSTFQVALLSNTKLFLFLLSKFPSNFNFLKTMKYDYDILTLAAQQNPFNALNLLLMLGYNTKPNLFDSEQSNASAMQILPLEHMFSIVSSSLAKATILLAGITQLLLIGDYAKSLNQQLFSFLKKIKTFLNNEPSSSQRTMLSRQILICSDLLITAKIFERFNPELRAIVQEIKDIACKNSTKCAGISLKEMCLLHIKHNSVFHNQKTQYDRLPSELKSYFESKCPVHWRSFLMQVFITFNDMIDNKTPKFSFFKMVQLLSNMKFFYPKKFNEFAQAVQANIEFGSEIAKNVT